MPFAQVTLKSIEVHNTDEGDSEWHLNVGAETWGASKQFNWNVDGVSDGDVYSFSENGKPVSTALILAPGKQVFIHAGGFAEDDPGFPLFDDHDGLPGSGFTVDTAAVSAGDDYPVSASAGAFHYTLHWDFNYFA